MPVFTAGQNGDALSGPPYRALDPFLPGSGRDGPVKKFAPPLWKRTPLNGESIITLNRVQHRSDRVAGALS